MPTLTDEQFEDIDSELANAQPPLPEIVSELLKVDGAYGRLLKKINNKPVLIARDTREFRLDEPLYIRRIEVFGGSNDKIAKSLSLTAVLADGKKLELKPIIGDRKNSDGSKTPFTQYVVKGFVTALSVRSKLAYRKLTISRIVVLGYSLSQLDLLAKKLEKAVDTYYSLDSYVSTKQELVEKAADEKGLLDEEIATLEAQKEQLAQNKEDFDLELTDLNEQVKVATESLEKVNANLRISQDALSSTRNSDSQLKESIDAANKEIVKRREELQKLIEDRSLISDEYRDYVSEGKGQATQYLLLLALPLVVIAFCSWQLYTGAVRILELNASSIPQVLSLSLQRLPFAAAIALVVAVCWRISSLLIARIIVIHEQRLALARLLVIAKDTIVSSAAGLELSDEDRFRERMHLKLEMLKGHLTSELGRGFNYHPLDNEDSRQEKVDKEEES